MDRCDRQRSRSPDGSPSVHHAFRSFRPRAAVRRCRRSPAAVEPGPAAVRCCRRGGRRRGRGVAVAAYLQPTSADATRRAERGAGGRAHPRRLARRAQRPSPAPTRRARCSRTPSRSGRHRHRLRRRHEPRRHPLDPPRPGPDRRALPRHIAPALHGEPFTETYTGTLGPVGARGRPGARRHGGSSGWWRSGSRSRPSARALSPQIAAAARRRPRSALALAAGGSCWSAAGCAARPTAWGPPSWPGCTSTTTPCCTPCARGCCCSTASGRVQLVNDEARRLLDLPDDGRRPPRRRRWACPPALGGRAGRRRRAYRRDPPDRRPGRRGQPGAGPLGRAASWARWSRCATTPSCRRSSGELDSVRGLRRVAASPRPTRRPTGCTPWSR